MTEQKALTCLLCLAIRKVWFFQEEASLPLFQAIRCLLELIHRLLERRIAAISMQTLAVLMLWEALSGLYMRS